MVVLEIINRDLYRHRLDEDNRGRYFTVYLGHNQYAELKMNPNYYHHIINWTDNQNYCLEKCLYVWLKKRIITISQ